MEENVPFMNGNGPVPSTELDEHDDESSRNSTTFEIIDAQESIIKGRPEPVPYMLPLSSAASSSSKTLTTTATTSTSTAASDDEGSGEEELSSFMESYDWEKEKMKKNQFYDDGTMSFFWRAHTLTTLFLLIVVLVHVALFENAVEDSEYNAKRGMMAVLGFFVLMGVTVIPDGPFLRPHPAFWRLMFCCSIVYFLSLIYLLFQNKDDARKLLRMFDPILGRELEERSYGGNCRIYDSDVPNDPFHNVWDKFDLFVPMHFFGWWLKTLILRDWWLCTVISIMFEILEYTLEHQLPNFSECWWDHWILDAMFCNGVGIFVGIQTLKYFRVRTYHWRGLWSIPGYKGKLKRILAQFGPHSWIEFDWKPTSSLGRWLATLGIIFAFLLAELNTFYLKFVLWVPPGHWLNLVRLFAILFWGAVCLRETFQYLDDPQCKSFGRQSWMVLAIISTEFLIVAKFDPVTITKPIPGHISLFWLIGILILAIWTILNFGYFRRVEDKGPGPIGSSKSDSHLSILRKKAILNAAGGVPAVRTKSFNVHFRPKSS